MQATAYSARHTGMPTFHTGAIYGKRCGKSTISPSPSGVVHAAAAALTAPKSQLLARLNRRMLRASKAEGLRPSEIL